MAFIAQFWWLWIICLGGFGFMTYRSQFGGLKKTVKSLNRENVSLSVTADTFFSNFGKAMAFGALAWLSGVLLAISIVANLIMFAK